MKKAIVSTSINPWTKAYEEFSKKEDWELIIVADRKTPHDFYAGKPCTYLSCEDQERMYPALSDLLGWNTVDRRNLGFLYAYEKGADIVAMVDDDNIPYEQWGKNVVLNKLITVLKYTLDSFVFDPMYVVCGQGTPLWHRGYPIEVKRIHYSPTLNFSDSIIQLGESFVNNQINGFWVQADWWNGAPDVDAICRIKEYPLTPRCFIFKNKFYCDGFSPFNMQNTFVHRKALKYVISIPETGRMCDIWGAYYFQAHHPGRTVYAPASVLHEQERTWESLCDDMEQEMLGYRYTLKLLKDLQKDPEAIHKYIPERSSKFIKLYQERFK